MTVLFKNTDITIYNHYYDDGDKYKRTVIEDVNWQGKRNATVGDKGVNIADTTLIFIDKLDNYIKPKQFLTLTYTGTYNPFTFNVGDKIVKGVLDYEMTKISDLDKNFDDVVTIVAIRELSDHWEIEAK